MMDDADRASEYETKARAQALARMQTARQAPGTAFCIDCEEEIPARRKAAYPACCRCVACQSAYEQT